jgi:hypothetical protein
MLHLARSFPNPTKVLVSQGDAYMLFEMNIVHYPRYMAKYPCHQSIVKIVLTH